MVQIPKNYHKVLKTTPWRKIQKKIRKIRKIQILFLAFVTTFSKVVDIINYSVS
jgi:hypothetical protein